MFVRRIAREPLSPSELSGQLRLLRGGVRPVLDARNERARRERIAGRIVGLTGELSVRRARRQRFGLGVAIAALVGACALVIFLSADARAIAALDTTPSAELRLVGGHASVRSGSSLQALDSGQLALPSDSVLVTRAEEEAELRLTSDTALSLSPSTELGVVRASDRSDSWGGFEERVRLRKGRVAFRVPELGAYGKVSVETRDALIEVHGTQFSVRVIDRLPLDSFTEVQVREGRVLVRSGDQSQFLGAGESWSSRDGQHDGVAASVPAAPLAAKLELPSRAQPEPASPASHRHGAHARRHAPARSVLAAQNRLLEAAELAQKSGMTRLALQRFELLIARYPSAELAHNARVERFRVLGQAGRHEEAVAAARDYLEQHPGGFARDEALRLIESLSRRSSPEH